MDGSAHLWGVLHPGCSPASVHLWPPVLSAASTAVAQRDRGKSGGEWRQMIMLCRHSPLLSIRLKKASGRLLKTPELMYCVCFVLSCIPTRVPLCRFYCCSVFCTSQFCLYVLYSYWSQRFTPMLSEYLSRLSMIVDSKLNCGPVLTWMEVRPNQLFNSYIIRT